MKNRLQMGIIFMLLSMSCSLSFAQNKVIHRIFLVGDAGELKKNSHPVCEWLKRNVDWKDTTNMLVYLGDNIYPNGMPAPGSKTYEEARTILDYQLSVTKGTSAKTYFVPGNHDWRKGKVGGQEQIKNQQVYIDSLNLPNVQLLPRNGCPGPEEVLLGDKVVLVFMDSQWWLQQTGRPGLESDCDCKNEEEVATALKDIAGRHRDKMILLVMHHPFYTYGPHGGYFTLKQHIFPLTDINPNLYIPLPVIGSLYPITRGWFGNIQDTKHPLYRDMIERLTDAVKDHPSVVQVAGHEHSLQLLKRDSSMYVISGSGSKETRIRAGSNSLFHKKDSGLAVIEIMENGAAQVKFYTVGSKNLDEVVYEAKLPSVPSASQETISGTTKWPDSITVNVGESFKAGPLKRFFLGRNYRNEWNTEVTAKVFDITGYKPLKRGGGHQSKSLRLEDKNGKQWVLRSVRKYVTDAALPPDLRGTVAKDLVSDGISASYPYAALSVPPLATAAGVPHANPQLVYVPDDPRLGKFRSDFANALCIFEEREPGDAKKTYSTLDMDEKLRGDNDNNVDQEATLQARLLDMFMMDFDRHEDQWRWAAKDNGKGKTYYPIPRDRDQPFFINVGLIPYIASRPWIAPQLQGFRSKASDIAYFNFAARNFDRNYLNELTEDQWKQAATKFVALMTDDVIEQALHLQPASLHRYDMNSIISKLKKRRQYFVNEMIGYYKFLSKIVTVVGSEKKESFTVQRNEDGSVLITVFKVNKEGESNKKIYERKFLAGETKEIRLYGLGGDDQFSVQGQEGPVCVRIIGGAGSDQFDVNSTAPAAKTKLYDLSTEQNQITGSGAYKSKLSDDPAVNELNRLGYKYNVFAPFIAVGFNPDDGVYLGVTAKYTQQGFRKQPFKVQHSILALHSLATNAYNFRYGLVLTDVLGKADLLLNANIKAPNNTTNFFKYGNETVFDKSGGKNIRYYRARYNWYELGLQLRGNITNSFTISGGPVFSHFSMDSSDNKSRFITQTVLNGLDQSTLYKEKSYGGLQAAIVFDNRNNKAMPTRGINFQLSGGGYKGLRSYSNDFAQLNSELSLFTSFSKRAGFVLATRVGAGVSFGKYEFFQAQYLSGTDNLRGYRKNRFAGDQIFYHNLDMRVRLADFKTYLFPGTLGLVFFNDLGKVWLEGEKSNEWHHGYGGGIWIAPLKRFAITATYGYGSDGGFPLVTFGWMY